MKTGAARCGFTIIELVVVIALIAIMIGIYLVVANPAGQLASSRNSERLLDLQAIMNAIYSNRYDQTNEQFLCSSAGALPVGTSSAKFMASASTSANYNIGPCLAPTYISVLPFDPSASGTYYNTPSDYSTGFKVSINSSGTVITLSAPYAELNKTVSVSR